jgi:hypothetical protein
LYHSVQEARKSVLQGWLKPNVVFGGKKGDTPYQQNTVSGELREFPEGVTPNVPNKPAESVAKVNKDNSTTKKNNAGAGKAGASAANAAQRIQLQRAYDAAILAVRSAQADLKTAQQAFDTPGTKAAQAKLDAASAQFNTATANLNATPGKTPAPQIVPGNSLTPATPPANATGKAPGSDGKMHYHDAQGRDLGVVQ